MNCQEIDALSNEMIGYAIKVHKSLGPGFAEKVYAEAIAHELKKNSIEFEKEKHIKIKYDDVLVGEHRLDFLVKNALILEIKAVFEINNFHMAQTLSYLKATNKSLGLILNFARTRLQIRRVVHNF
jgi:GxxExxY protein